MEEKIRNILSGVIHPETQQDIVSSGIVESVSAEGGKVLVKLSFAKAHDPFAARLRTQAQQIARAADFAPRHLAVANIHDRVLIVQRQIMHHKLHVFAKMPL